MFWYAEVNMPLTDDLRAKIALFCNVPVSHVLQNLDVEYLYEAPLAMEREETGTGGHASHWDLTTKTRPYGLGELW